MTRRVRTLPSSASSGYEPLARWKKSIIDYERACLLKAALKSLSANCVAHVGLAHI
jgi:hypothetical protein